jgi:hypothetical protein
MAAVVVSWQGDIDNRIQEWNNTHTFGSRINIESFETRNYTGKTLVLGSDVGSTHVLLNINKGIILNH